MGRARSQRNLACLGVLLLASAANAASVTLELIPTTRAPVYVPVPEPSSLTLLGLGLALVARSRHLC